MTLGLAICLAICVWALPGIVTIWVTIDSELRLFDLFIAALIGPICVLVAGLDALDQKKWTFKARKK